MKEEEKGEAAPSCANHVLSRDSRVTLVVIAAKVQSLSLRLPDISASVSSLCRLALALWSLLALSAR